MGEREMRDAIVAAGVRLGARGLIAAGEGNVSGRLESGRLLVTPTGRRKDDLRPGDLLAVDADAGETPDGPMPSDPSPSSDLAIHRALLAARPDASAVVHAHLPAAMALTLAGETPDPRSLPETALFLPVLPVVPFAPMGSAELADRVAAVFASGDPRPAAVILERHGAIAIGEGAAGDAAAVTRAVDRLELVDVLCRVWRDALLLRGARGRLDRS